MRGEESSRGRKRRRDTRGEGDAMGLSQEIVMDMRIEMSTGGSREIITDKTGEGLQQEASTTMSIIPW